MKATIFTLFYLLFLCVSLSAQIKVDNWYIYNSSDFNTVADKISKTLGGRPTIKNTAVSKVALWDLNTNIGSKELAYGKTHSNIAFVMMTYKFYYDEEKEANDCFDTLYKKSCKEEGGESKLLREESNKIGESIKEYKWVKDEYYKTLSIKHYLDDLTLSFSWQIVEAEFSRK